MLLTNIVLALAGVWLITTALVLNTHNFTSSLLFKVVPFFIGAACFVALANNVGWFNIPMWSL